MIIPGKYEVSNIDGKIRNSKTGRILKPDKDKYGYRHVVLYKDGKPQRFSVHRLVAFAFIPNSHNKPFVNHIDENPSNNSASNLAWCTQQENVNHGTCQERRAKTIRGAKHPQAKKVICIETGQVFDTVKEAQEWLGKGDIYVCCQGKKKTAGGFHWEYVD